MFVDIALYEKSRPFVIDFYESKGKDINRTISMMAGITMVPCIVIAYWLGEHTNWDPKVIDSIKKLQDFYDYTEIMNKPPGSPL